MFTKLFPLTGVFLLFLVFTTLSQAQNCIDLGGGNPTSYSQNFDGLGASPAPRSPDAANIAQLSVTPRRYLGKFDNAFADNNQPVNVPGWALVEEGTNTSSVSGRYGVGDGSAAGANTFSFASAAASSDRAFGSITADDHALNWLGGCFRNTGPATVAVAISYTGEMWRRGASGGQTDRLDFEYAINAINIFSGAYSAHNSFDFQTPNTTGTAGARDGNAAAFRTVFPPALMPVALAPGAAMYVRWNDQNIAGLDDGLAIDDFTLIFLSPSAAAVEISGRVTDSRGRGLPRVMVSLNNSTGESRIAQSNPFGYYRFKDVAGGQTYVVSVAAKNRNFSEPSRVVELTDSLANVDFQAEP
jgi:hypothetical protein